MSAPTGRDQSANRRWPIRVCAHLGLRLAPSLLAGRTPDISAKGLIRFRTKSEDRNPHAWCQTGQKKPENRLCLMPFSGRTDDRLGEAWWQTGHLSRCAAFSTRGRQNSASIQNTSMVRPDPTRTKSWPTRVGLVYSRTKRGRQRPDPPDRHWLFFTFGIRPLGDCRGSFAGAGFQAG